MCPGNASRIFIKDAPVSYWPVFFFRLLVTVPEDFAKINPAQLTSRLGPMSLFEGENLTYFSAQPHNSH